MGTDADLAWAVEQACLNAWPAPRQLVLGRWLLRAAGGPSRRINSLNPLRAHAYDPAAAVALARPLYAALGQPLIVRAPDIATGLADRLAALGLEPQHETRTLFAALDDVGDLRSGPGVRLAAAPDADWFAVRASLGGGAAAEAAARAAIDALLLPRAFVVVPDAQGRAAAVAFGAVEGRLLVVEAVATLPAARGQGHGRTAVVALMGWARQQGATGACLQVTGDNAPALRLYARLGFATDLYRYRYCSDATIG